jgi:hypothetical protein
MSQTPRCDYLGMAGIVQSATAGAWDFIYKTSAVRDAKYNIGDRVVLPDGRVYRYCYSGGACWTGRGAAFYNAIPATGIDYANNIAIAAAIGDTKVKVTNGSTVVQTKDGLSGGWILFKTASGSTDAALQQRHIVGNDAMGLAADGWIYLDGPLSGALTTSSYSFCMPSPYNNIINAETIGNSAGAYGIAGIPATYVSASDYYFWTQTWGLCWIAPQGDLGAADNKRQMVFRWDGSVGPHDDSDAHEEYAQHAGFVVDNNLAGNGATLMMLQVSV